MKINAEIKSLIDELTEEWNKLKSFEQEIEEKKRQLEEKIQRQQEKYDFDTANDIKSLNLGISNANDVLKQKTLAFQELKKENNNKIGSLVTQDRENEVYADSELLKKKNLIYDAVEALNEAYIDYINRLNTLLNEYAQQYGHDNNILNQGTVHGFHTPQKRLTQYINFDTDIKSLAKAVNEVRK